MGNVRFYYGERIRAVSGPRKMRMTPGNLPDFLPFPPPFCAPILVAENPILVAENPLVGHFWATTYRPTIFVIVGHISRP